VENRLRDALKLDRARIQLGRISRFGLLEMSRQRLRPSLGEASLLTCPRCKGQGSIRNVESLALSVLRILEEESMKKNTDKIIAQLPIESATYLLNEKRSGIEQIEKRQNVSIIIVPNKHMETPDFDIQRVRAIVGEEEQAKISSYQLIRMESQSLPEFAREAPQATEKAAVREFLPPSPAPSAPVPATVSRPPQQAAPIASGGLIKRFLNILTGKHEDDAEALPVMSTLPPPRPLPTVQERPRQQPQERQDRRNQASRPQRPPQRQDRQQTTERGGVEPQAVRQDRQDKPERQEQHPAARRQILPRHGSISSGSVPSFAMQPSARVASTLENPPASEEEDGMQVEDNSIKREGPKRGSRRRRGRRGEGGNRSQSAERVVPQDGESLSPEAGQLEGDSENSESIQPALVNIELVQENTPLLVSSSSQTDAKLVAGESPTLAFLPEQEEPQEASKPPRPEPVPRRHQQRPPRPRPATTYIDWVEPSPLAANPVEESDQVSAEPAATDPVATTGQPAFVASEPIRLESSPSDRHDEGGVQGIDIENDDGIQLGNEKPPSAPEGEVADSEPRRPPPRRRSRRRPAQANSETGSEEGQPTPETDATESGNIVDSLDGGEKPAGDGE
jgi:ribonuclease E